jgi:hypothetical protein
MAVGTGARHLSCALVNYARESGEMAAARFFETNSTRAKVRQDNAIVMVRSGWWFMKIQSVFGVLHCSKLHIDPFCNGGLHGTELEPETDITEKYLPPNVNI